MQTYILLARYNALAHSQKDLLSVHQTTALREKEDSHSSENPFTTQLYLQKHCLPLIDYLKCNKQCQNTKISLFTHRFQRLLFSD